MEKVTLNETPRRTSKSFGINNYKIEDFELPEVKEFTNVTIDSEIEIEHDTYDFKPKFSIGSLLSFMRKILVFILRVILICLSTSYLTIGLAPSFLRNILKFFDIVSVETNSVLAALLLFVLFTLAHSFWIYASGCVTAAYVFIIERKRIMKMRWYKKVWFCITFPIFDYIGKVSSCVALFKKVEWKPIPHKNNVTIDDVDKKINTNK